ncbi:M4 family metallopeptidase [Kitasatospora sp. NPDC059599]|uniref:M4 family metallopeptidase n=1 Tax=Kitasatospora sp. NPDC059599 TaxID=3346880 RepID=UPI0036C44FAB
MCLSTRTTAGCTSTRASPTAPSTSPPPPSAATPEKAGRIWYDAATGGKLAADATFADFAELTATVAEDLYGSGTELDAVDNAWKTVGVR